MACSAQPAFFIQPKPAAQEAYSELGPVTSITNQDSGPQTYLQASLMGCFLSWGSFFPEMSGFVSG